MSQTMFPLGELSSRLPGPLDLFVCSASYEERCLSIPRAVSSTDVRASIIAENRNHKELHGAPAVELQGLLPTATRADLSTADPLSAADALYAALAPHADDSIVLVDISTFTHEALLILCRILMDRFRSQSVWFAYARAGEYSIGDPPEKKWLSMGVSQIRSVVGFPGVMLPSRRLHMIVLAGLEVERVAELLRQYEPALLSLGTTEGIELADDKHRQVNLERFATLRSRFLPATEFAFDCHDAKKTKDAILTRCAAVPDHNTVVASMNTKISTVGAALAANEQSDIQLCYAQAVVYNYRRYSTPGEDCCLFQCEW